MKKIFVFMFLFCVSAFIFAEDITFTSASGRIMGFLKDGVVTNANGKIKGFIEKDGTIKSGKGAIIGYLNTGNDAQITFANGKILGYVSEDGIIKSAKGSIKGYVKDNGTILNASGRIIGVAKPFTSTKEQKKLIGCVFYYIILY